MKECDTENENLVDILDTEISMRAEVTVYVFISFDHTSYTGHTLRTQTAMNIYYYDDGFTVFLLFLVSYSKIRISN